MKATVAPHETGVKCLRIECTDGTIIRLTRYPFDLTMSNGQVYLSTAGADLSAYDSTTAFSASAVDLDGFVGYAGITRDKIASGVFDNARAYLFATNFLAPVEDYEPIVSSIVGKTTLEDDVWKAEEMALVDALGQAVGLSYQAACSRTFGDAGCTVSLAAITEVGAITHVTSQSSFRDSSRTEAADYFGGGTISFTSGPNVGLKPLEIRSYALDGSIVTYESAYYTVEVGHTFTITPGCRKTLAACKVHQGHVLNHFGFPDAPTSSVYAQIGAK
jgi:uncharacterized phage protein (TIGR02218 family)